MKFRMQVIIVVLFATLLPGGFVSAKSGDVSEYPGVTAPPESFFEKVRESDRQAAREFYSKYIDVKGMPAAAAAEAYFDAAGAALPPNDSDHPIATRETLNQYDPGLFALVEETMAYKGKVDWRYRK